MAQVTITIADNKVDRVLEALGWPLLAQGGETKLQFAKRIIREYLINCVRGYEASNAADTARDTAVATVVSEVEPHIA